MTKYVQFASGHVIEGSKLGIIEPVFTVRRSVKLSVHGAAEVPMFAPEPAINLVTTTFVDVEHRLYSSEIANGRKKEMPYLVVGRYNALHIIGQQTDSLADSAALASIDDKEMRSGIISSITKLIQYHARYNQYLAAEQQSQVPLAQNPLIGDSPLNKTSADMDRNFRSRARKLADMLNTAEVITEEASETPLSGIFELIDYLNENEIAFDRESLTEELRVHPIEDVITLRMTTPNPQHEETGTEASSEEPSQAMEIFGQE